MAAHCKCTWHYWIVHLKLVEIVNVILHIYIITIFKRQIKKGRRKRMQSTHSSSSGSSLGDKDPTSLSSLPVMVARVSHGLNLQECTEWGSPWMYFMRISLAGHRTGQSREEDLKGQKEAGQRGSCHWIICSFREASNPQSQPTTKKGVAEKSWGQVFFPQPETAVHNQSHTAVYFPVNLENPCWNAMMFIYIFWSRNPASRNLP